jgi:hypothetical protein
MFFLPIQQAAIVGLLGQKNLLAIEQNKIAREQQRTLQNIEEQNRQTLKRIEEQNRDTSLAHHISQTLKRIEAQNISLKSSSKSKKDTEKRGLTHYESMVRRMAIREAEKRAKKRMLKLKAKNKRK